MVMSPSRQAAVAAAAALVASGGDFLLLYVASARSAGLGDSGAAEASLWIGGVLGVVAIPMYALGYSSASRVVATASASGSRALFATGAAGALLGSAIHGLTAAHIGTELAAEAPGRDPLQSILGSSPLLLVLWGLAALFVLGASAVFAWFVGRGPTTVPRCAALANPALVTIVLATLGLPFVLGRTFLTPAAPNLAHLVFFLVCSRVLGSAGFRSDARAA